MNAKPRGIRQTMSDLHIWTGLLVSWILYAIFLTGTVSYFRDEISVWMRPELPAASHPSAAPELAQRMIDAMSKTHAPGGTMWSIRLPTPRDPTVFVFWRDESGFASATLDPASGARVSARDTKGGDFFFSFHFNLHYIPRLWGRWIAGVSAMFMLVAIVSGVITHKKIFTDFFTFRWGKGQRSWLDGHAALSVLGLPFHFMVTYSGLVTLMVLYMPWGMQSVASPEIQAAVTNEIRFKLPAPEPHGAVTALTAIAPLVQQAEARWGRGSVRSVEITKSADNGARVAITQAQSRRVSTTPRYLVFDGVSGELVTAKEHSGPAAETQGVFYGLHMGRFADLMTRWLYFLSSLAGTTMIASGLVLWTVKRRTKLADPQRPYFGFRLVERLNIATIAGLPFAMAGMLWANRLLPLNVPGRAECEIHLFFILWALMLFHAALRPPKRAWVEQFLATAAALALLPALNLLTTTRGLPGSLTSGDFLFAGFDLALLALAATSLEIARRTARHQPRQAKKRRRAGSVGEAT
ncbi:PepSY-associated TM helix domain-containing protein [Paracoccus xiamenensis]|uniref:PepSY-associated TM helix domain-containing protein n=1 Tax=Paracoccus xiamenensis TaxID=2714901 RepID=UPI00140B6BE4|nr:PepSY-associated TM helix domain-containing protein [Paracoccus xiamenensis]NHF73471.1 PepSY domain-containing protein [Paracoccus xiamenensis]